MTIGAYKAEPDAAPRGAIVLLQEIFGVNAHIRRVADRFARDGYLVVAPALFDRVEPDVELGYDAEAFPAAVGGRQGGAGAGRSPMTRPVRPRA